MKSWIELEQQDMLLILLKQYFGWFSMKTHMKKTVLKAVNLGGDTDTIAALAGGCAGVIYGFSSINDRWIQNVAKLAEIKQLIDDFRATLVN